MHTSFCFFREGDACTRSSSWKSSSHYAVSLHLALVCCLAWRQLSSYLKRFRCPPILWCPHRPPCCPSLLRWHHFAWSSGERFPSRVPQPPAPAVPGRSSSRALALTASNITRQQRGTHVSCDSAVLLVKSGLVHVHGIPRWELLSKGDVLGRHQARKTRRDLNCLLIIGRHLVLRTSYHSIPIHYLRTSSSLSPSNS